MGGVIWGFDLSKNVCKDNDLLLIMQIFYIEKCIL